MYKLFTASGEDGVAVPITIASSPNVCELGCSEALIHYIQSLTA